MNKIRSKFFFLNSASNGGIDADDKTSDKTMFILVPAFFIVFSWILLRAIAARYPHVMGDEYVHSTASRYLFSFGPLRAEYLYNFIYYFTNFFGDSFYTAAKVFNFVFFCAAIPFIYMIARRVCSKTVALIVALLAFASPVNIYTTLFMAEMPLFFFFWLLSWFVLNCDRMRAARPLLFWGIAGILLGLSSFIRPRILFLSPAIAAYIAYLSLLSKDSSGRFTWIKNIVSFFLHSAIFMLLLFITRECVTLIFAGGSFARLLMLGGGAVVLYPLSLFASHSDRLRKSNPYFFWGAIGILAGLAVFLSAPAFLVAPLGVAYLAYYSFISKEVREENPKHRNTLNFFAYSILFICLMLFTKEILGIFLAENPIAKFLQSGYMSEQVNRALGRVTWRQPASFAGEGIARYFSNIYLFFLYCFDLFQSFFEITKAHTASLAIMYGYPLIMAFVALFPGSLKQTQEKQAIKKITIYSIVILFILIAGTIAYSHIGGQGHRIIMRYYNLAFPFFFIMAAFAFSANPKNSKLQYCIALLIAAIMLYAVITKMQPFRIEQNDCPDLRGIAFNDFTWYSFCILSLFSVFLLFFNKRLSAHVYLLMAVPLMSLYSFINPDLYTHGHIPSAFQRGAIFARQNYNETILSKMDVVGNHYDEQLKALFHIGTPTAAMRRVTGGTLNLASLPQDRWHLVVGEYAVEKDESWLSWETPHFSVYGKIKPIRMNFSQDAFNVEFLSKLFGVAGITGVSVLDDWEDWGIWSSENSMRIDLLRPLPEKFRMRVVARAFGPNIGEPFLFRAGGQEREIRLGGRFMAHSVEFDGIHESTAIGIVVPSATSPLELGLSRREARELGAARKDVRKLGIALAELHILEDEDYLYTLGQTLDFARGGNSFNYADYGWSFQEDTHRWTDGFRSGLRLNLQDAEPESDLLLRINAFAYLGGGITHQAVDVFANGEKIATWLVNDPQWHHAFIPHELLGNGILDIMFAVTEPVIPKDKGDSKDARMLGMAVKKVVLQKQQRYSFGNIISFAGDAADGAEFYPWGLSPAEQDGTWTEGKKGRLYIPLANAPKQDLKLQLGINSIYGDRQRLTASIGDSLLFDELIGSGTERIEIIIPRAFVEGEALGIDLGYPNASSPESLEEGSDSRELAFKWKTMILDEAPDHGLLRSYLLADTVAFNREGTSSMYTLYGWSFQEETHRWTDGTRSAMLLNIRNMEPGTDLLLRMNAFSYFAKESPYQTVEVFANGIRVATWRVADPRWHNAFIPSALLKDDMLEVVFAIAAPAIPGVLGDSEDVRRLGIAATELVIEKQTRYSLGETLAFSRNAPGAVFYPYGLSWSEEDGSWTSGKEGALYIPFADSPGHDLLLELGVNNIYRGRQRLIASTGETLLFDGIIEGGTEKVELFIPKTAVENNILEIRLEYPDAVSPKSRRESEDARELAFKWDAMTLKEAPDYWKIRRYTPGERILFDREGANSRFLAYGWSIQEEKHRWTDGPRSAMLFNIQDAENADLLLRIEAEAYLGRKLPYQTVGVFANGHPIATWQIEGRKSYEAVIPFETLDNGMLSLIFTISSPTAPSDEGESKDPRKLGMAVSELVIEKQRVHNEKDSDSID